jgi:hypothetical protein
MQGVSGESRNGEQKGESSEQLHGVGPKETKNAKRSKDHRINPLPIFPPFVSFGYAFAASPLRVSQKLTPTTAKVTTSISVERALITGILRLTLIMP